MRNEKTSKGIKKINRMSNEELLQTVKRMQDGQSHTYENSNGDTVTKQGAPHVNSKYYSHLSTEVETRFAEGRL
jgi:hypothetical protein